MAHDASSKRQLGYSRIGLVIIEDDVFIGVGAIVMPGVTVGKGSVVGAYSVVTKDVPPGMVAVGNPARIICKVDEYMDRKGKELKSVPIYEMEYTLARGITAEMKQEMFEALASNGGIGYVR